MAVNLPPQLGVSSSSIWVPRSIIAFFISTTILLPRTYDPLISWIWSYLYNSPIYRLSTIESIEILILYAFIEPIYVYRFARNPSLRIDVRPYADSNPKAPKLPYLRRPTKRLEEIMKSILPLATLDLILIKKYTGVPIADIRESGGYDRFPGSQNLRIHASFLVPTLHNFASESLLQLKRALPLQPPSSRRIVLELLVAFFIYDSLFFLIHIAFHKIPALCRIHHPHHTHAEINPQVTNQLSIVERVSLILVANFALNIIGGHVLTRTLFVPFFVYLLVEVHSGMDLPWGYDKIMPWGMGAGSKKHAVHHRVGEGHYAPFFCWWDDAVVALEAKLKKL